MLMINLAISRQLFSFRYFLYFPVQWAILKHFYRSALPLYLNKTGALARQKSGWAGIRTQGTLTGTAVFKTAAFDHSATHPIIVAYPYQRAHC